MRLAALALLATPLAAQTWLASGSAWQYRKVRAIDRRFVVGGPHSGFTAFLDLSGDTDIVAHAKADASDIVIADTSGARISTGASGRQCWGTFKCRVGPLTVSGTSDTVIVIYYGNAAANEADDTAIWDASTEHVMEWRGGSLADSAGKHSALTPAGAVPPTTVSTDLYWDAKRFYNDTSEFSGGPSYTPSAYTVSVWVKADRGPFGGGGPDTTYLASFGWGFFRWDYVASNWSRGGWSMPAGGNEDAGCPQMIEGIPGGSNDPPDFMAEKWFLLTATWDGSTLIGYYDGSQQGDVKATSTRNAASALRIGRFRGNLGPFVYETTARSAGWIATRAYNEHPALRARFWKVGAEHTNTTAAIDSFTASYANIRAGGETDLCWITNGATSVSINNGPGSQTDLVAGCVTVAPSATTTYTITVNGSVTAQTTVTILTEPVVHFRIGAPGGVYLFGENGHLGYELHGSGTAQVLTDRVHGFKPGDIIGQWAFAADSVTNNWSNLNGSGWRVRSVLDTRRYLIEAHNGSDVTPNGAYISGTFTSGNGISVTHGGSMIGRVEPRAVDSTFKGFDPLLLRKYALGTHNGLTSLIVVSGSGNCTPQCATVTTSFTHDVRVDDLIGVTGTSAAALNAENHVVRSVTATTYSFGTSAAASTYTTNTGCWLPWNDNCVVVSQIAVQGNANWAKIKADGDDDPTHVYDGGSATGATGAAWGAYRAHPLRFLIYPTQTAVDQLKYLVLHPHRIVGVNYSVWEGTQIDGSYSLDVNNIHYTLETLGYSYSLARGRLTSQERTDSVSMIFNGLADDCTKSTPERVVIHTSTAAAGSDSTTLVFNAAYNPSTDALIGAFALVYDTTANYVYYGRISTNTGDAATIAATTRTSLYRDDNILMGGTDSTSVTWPTVTEGQTYYIIAGISGTATGSTSVTIHGTAFDSDWVGDAVSASYAFFTGNAGPHSSSAMLSAQAGGTGTIVYGAGDNVGIVTTPVPLWRITRWTTGSCGLYWAISHYNAACSAQPIHYPPNAGKDCGFMGRSNNNTPKWWNPLMNLGLAYLQDDPRPVALYEQSQQYYVDRNIWTSGYMFPFTNQGAAGYAWGNTIGLAGILAGYPFFDATTGTKFTETWPAEYFEHLDLLRIYMTHSDQAWSGTGHLCPMWFGGYGGGEWCFQTGGGSFNVSNALLWKGQDIAPSGTVSRQYRDWLSAANFPTRTYTSDLSIAMWDFRLADQGDFTTLPLQKLFRGGYPTQCNALTGQDCTHQQPAILFMRGAWQDRSATSATFQGYDTSQGYNYPHHGALTVYKAGYLLQDDNLGNAYLSVFVDTRDGSGVWMKNANLRYGANDEYSSRSPVSRYTAGTNYVYAMADMRRAFTTTYNQVERDMVWFRKSGKSDVFIKATRVDTTDADGWQLGDTAAGSNVGIYYSTHYAQNEQAQNMSPVGGIYYDEGSTTCESCSAGVLGAGSYILSQQDGTTGTGGEPNRTNAVISKYFSPRTIAAAFETSWTGSAGYTNRVKVCAGSSCGTAANNLEVVEVHKISTDRTNDITVTVTALDPDSNWTGVQINDSTAGKRAYLMARGTTLLTSFTSTTLDCTDGCLWSGFSAGTYYVLKGGSLVTSVTIVDGDNTAYVETGSGVINITTNAPEGDSVLRGTMRGTVR